VRELLAQKFMHALVPPHASLMRDVRQRNACAGPVFPRFPSFDPDILVDNPARDLHTRAPSFLRVGQLELSPVAPARAHRVRYELQMIHDLT